MDHLLQQILKETFGFDTFRPSQSAIIHAVVERKDVLAIMPTGGGKSLCYQIPALARPGLCLVISPLIALMNDQVQQLRRRHITAFAIHTGMQRKEIVSILKTAANSNCKFLYVSPERIETTLFKEYLPALNVNLIAVDEAHCISQWGYDFRPAYLRIAALREQLPEVPVIALTASATPKVQEDICQKLSLEERHRFSIFRHSFERKNLAYAVVQSQNKIPAIIQQVQSSDGAVIIYCGTRKKTKEIADLLQHYHIAAEYYHAGLSTEERNTRQERWIKNLVNVIVCTNAFGMGIDKPDVRLVVHVDIPDCLENYYQEAGRAGRDGKPAQAVLFYKQEDLQSLRELPEVRYPSYEKVQSIYSAVVNYLQIPAHTPPGEYYDFDIKDFMGKFKLDFPTAYYGLKAMEQDGWISFNEQVFLPSTVQFNAYKDELYEYEKTFPQAEPLIKTLLRTYEGIYDYQVSVSEKHLAYLLRTDTEKIREQLNTLHQHSIILYQPQKHRPQLLFLKTRVHTSDFYINIKNYVRLKELFTARVNTFINYLIDTKNCRSKQIAGYFGDTEAKDCGICDNCRNKNISAVTKDDFYLFKQQLERVLKTPVTTHELLRSLSAFPEQKIWETIQHFTDKGNIELLSNGKLQWKG